MKASIITIGDEIVDGLTPDYNAPYLASRLGALGIKVLRLASVGDVPQAIVDELKRAMDLSDLVFVTGGLGPTHDDVTKEAVAQATGRALVLDNDLRRRLEERYRGHVSATAGVISRLATIPAASDLLENPVGAAAGLAIEHSGRRLFILPGVPREMEAMFETSLVAELRQLATGDFTKSRLLKTVGIRESEIAERLKIVIPSLGVKLAFLPRTAGVDLRLTATGASEAACDEALDAATGGIMPLLGRYAYSAVGEELHKVVGRLLLERGLAIAVAESCTGGLIGHLLTDVPGISASLDRDVIAYSNTAKVEGLGVDEALIGRHGAVSLEVARAMASGVRNAARTDLGLATTGIAGPTGGNAEKPVGLVYMALAFEGGVSAGKHVFTGDRHTIKQRAAAYALDLIRLRVMKTEV
jgi:nicotinamide-nucleotide amidase